tara:strand:+ start:575 stop:2149 length:1575 start_codon:yes stop_codon:yes gene_type:complete
MVKVLVSDSIADQGIELLENSGFDVIYTPNATEGELELLVKDINAWVVRSGTQVTSNLLKDAKKLQVIGRAGVGVDNIDIESATAYGVIVMNIPDGNTISAAEHTIAMMMSLSRNIQIGHQSLLDGEWNRSTLVGTELRGKCLGVVGLGRIGREVIKRALGLEMDILGYDPYVSKEIFNDENIRVVDLDCLVSESDYITVHVPLTDSTKNLFDLERLSKMKTSARIINIARGGIINELDLVKVLNAKQISGAAIDVFETEPLDKTHPFITAKNILLTPHLGASTIEASEGVAVGICRQVSEFLLEEKLSNPINMPINDLSEMKKITASLDLAKVLGSIGSQLATSAIKNISIECFGEINDAKPIAFSYMIGLLQNVTDTRLNFVNVPTIAKERGISFSYSINTENTSYSNLISIVLSFEHGDLKLVGSVFGNKFRIVQIMDYKLDFIPEGNMIFIQNKDVPGVIGKVGMLLGKYNANIGEYLLGRNLDSQDAYSVVKVDEKISSELIAELMKMDEIISVEQIAL